MFQFDEEIISAIEPPEIKAYFRRLSGQLEAERIFDGEGWQVALEYLPPRQHGVIRLPATRVSFKGEESVCKALMAQFRKTFMRGGG